ncbi:MAG: hypothetical protein ACYC64_07980 [Armatimonadota bacterium]
MATTDPIIERLISVARLQTTISYGDVANLMDIDLRNPEGRAEISRILGEVSSKEVQSGRPMLSAVVIYKDEFLPGPGFFELARTLGRFEDGGDKLHFYIEELRRVYEYWSGR